MKSSRAYFGIVGAVLISLGACVDNSASGVQRLADEIAVAVLETDRHHDTVLAAESMDTVMDDLAEHVSSMEGFMSGMEHGMGDMGHCSGMGELGEMMGEMQGEMSSHQSSMEGMSDLVEAQMQSDAHATHMGELFGQMDEALEHATCM